MTVCFLRTTLFFIVISHYLESSYILEVYAGVFE